MPTSDILALVQASPDVGTRDGAYVDALIECAKAFITGFCRLPAFPEFSRGQFVSGPGAQEDLTSLGAAGLLVSLHGSAFVEVSLDLPACTTGGSSAAALEGAIRAKANGDYLWERVEVAWAAEDGRYTVTSVVYGESSSVAVSFYPGSPEVVMAMRLAPEFGGRARPGTPRCEALEVICANLVIDAYRRARSSFEQYEGGEWTTPTSYKRGLFLDDESARSLLLAHRRLTAGA